MEESGFLARAQYRGTETKLLSTFSYDLALSLCYLLARTISIMERGILTRIFASSLTLLCRMNRYLEYVRVYPMASK